VIDGHVDSVDPFLVRFLCGGHNGTSTPVVRWLPMVITTLLALVVRTDGHTDTVGCYCFRFLYFGIPRTPTFSFCDARSHLFAILRSGNASSSSYHGANVASLCCNRGTLLSSIKSFHWCPPVLLILLTASLVEASYASVGCIRMWTSHSISALSRPISLVEIAANSLVNVGLIQHKDTVVHTSEFTREL
jgi:hypothetical protein